MLNTSELEAKWLKYKIKSYLPHGVIGISSVIIITIVIYLFDSYTMQQTPKALKKTKKTEKISAIKPPLKRVKKTIEKKLETKEKKIPIHTSELPKPKKTIQQKQIKLTPSLAFMKDMQASSLPYDDDRSIPNKKIQHKTVIKKPISKPKPKVQTLQKKTSTLRNKAEISKITIKRRDTIEDIQSIIRRFKKKNNPGLSLFIAKKYYELGDYEKSYNYALMTNKLNSNIEDSWLIFSKSLFKLGKEDEAMNTLKKYIKSSYSSNAKLLLEEMSSGRFQ